ncbi:MAG: ABC transporter permease subunit [Pirellulales bacterium]|nr:ABC transporter permease subunit [Pirellulales bacterium]
MPRAGNGKRGPDLPSFYANCAFEDRQVIGPMFTREAAVAPRRVSFFASRTLFVGALFALVLTSWQLLVGIQQIETVGDLAWFGAATFQVMAALQLAVAMPFAALLVSSAVALEKDRKTFELLLLTNLTNSDLVLGKLLAGMLVVVVMVAATLPLLMISALLGGVTTAQILRVEGVTLGSSFVAGSLGSTISLWREKTFQSVAMTALAIVLWLIAWEVVAATVPNASWLGHPANVWAMTMSPWQAMQEAARPMFSISGSSLADSDPVLLFLAMSCVWMLLLNGIAILRVRAWNPRQDIVPRAEEEPMNADAAGSEALSSSVNRIHGAGGKVRPVWDNPVLWREMRTWAFGKRVVVIRLAYWLLFFVCAAVAVSQISSGAAPERMIPAEAKPLVTLLVVGLILLNALAVTSLTSERDSRALDLLLVTDLTPKEIVFGKLGGAFYNAKEMVLLPAVLCGYLWGAGAITSENLVFLLVGVAVMNAFAAMLGLHMGINHANSRTAIAMSLGTILFLFLGVATCMRIMLAFTDSFENQFTTFLGFIAGGGVGLYVALNHRTDSAALAIVAGLAPFATFFAITTFLVGNFGSVFLVTVVTYGFATWAMLVPAIDVFDVATGRSSVREE